MEIKKHYLGVSLSLPLDTVPFHAILRDSSNSSWQYAYMSRKKRKEGEGGGGMELHEVNWWQALSFKILAIN